MVRQYGATALTGETEKSLKYVKIQQRLKMLDAVKKELNLITDSVVANTPVEAIYLFGSYAYGEPNADSDLDIYVVVPDTDTDTVELGAKIRYALYKKKTMQMDLLIGKKSVFDRRKSGVSLENLIAREGVKIYGNG
ncbi:MAG: nucleotidyltransferase domain-containing protein [Candidatus Margulisbacteria bacterium]|nr:nucleotidyltransferase domain-containing protein [Candidatus Margulisiibacteriota bacterium]